MTGGQNALPLMSMILVTCKCTCTHTIHIAIQYTLFNKALAMPQLTNKLT